MSLTKKIKGVMAGFLAILFIFTFLIGRTLVVNSSDINDRLDAQLGGKAYSYITITTKDNVVLYKNNAFSDDYATRVSTFHLVGDRNGGISNSLIATNTSNTIIKDKKSHQYFNDVNIKLTIDSKLQKFAYSTLMEQSFSNSGCLIVLNYKTGELKAMASVPSIDVENVKIEDGAFLNKALYAYVPGSVFKTISTAAVLEKYYPQAKNFIYTCSGKDGHISCSYAHGTVTLQRALEKSCNCAISKLVSRYLSANELENFVEKVELTDTVQMSDMICNQPGTINAKADLRWTANGQGETLMTPISIAKYYGVIANEGILMQPHILTNTKTEPTRLISKQTCDFIVDSLEGVAGDKIPFKTASKTGTAELVNDEAHSWYVCNLVDENAPKYTVLCFLEKGGTSLNAKDVTIQFINDYIL